MGLGVWGSAGLGAWRVWGSGVLGVLWREHVREKGGEREQKGRKRDEKGSRRAETESAGPKRAFRRFSEAPSANKSTKCS